MKRVLGPLALLAVVLVLSPAPVGRAMSPRQQPLDLTNLQGGGQMDSRIEKQSWIIGCCTFDPDHTIVNPGGIGSWDINDNLGWGASGNLAPGATTTGSWKHVWDWNPLYTCHSGYCANWSFRSNWYGATVASVSAGLAVTVCYQPQGRCFPLAPVWNSTYRQFWYRLCTSANYRPDDPAIVDITGSNGGRGVPTTMTLTVANPGLRLIKGVQADFAISSDVTFLSGCSGSDPNETPKNYAYPFAWSP